MLELRPTCEHCNRALPPESLDARICSYECTFCAACVEQELHDVCPNCGGGFETRPVRPTRSWRETTGLAVDPPGTRRRHTPYSVAAIAEFAAPIAAIPPAER